MNIATQEREISIVTDKVIQFMIERNVTGLTSLLHEDFTLTHLTGYVQRRKEWLSEIETESMKYYSAKKVKDDVSVTGGEAVSTVQHLLDARIWGSRNTWRLQQRMTLRKVADQWIVMNSIATTF